VITPHLLDWSDFIGRGVVLGVLSFIIAFVYWLFTIWSSNKELVDKSNNERKYTQYNTSADKVRPVQKVGCDHNL